MNETDTLNQNDTEIFTTQQKIIYELLAQLIESKAKNVEEAAKLVRDIKSQL